jgi:hypothetical protein
MSRLIQRLPDQFESFVASQGRPPAPRWQQIRAKSKVTSNASRTLEINLPLLLDLVLPFP